MKRKRIAIEEPASSVVALGVIALLSMVLLGYACAF